MRRQALLISLIICVLAMVAGCDAVFVQKTGSLDVSVLSRQARSILPSDMSIDSYSLSGTGPSGKTLPAMSSKTGAFSADDIAAGSWCISIKGMDSSGAEIVSGTKTVEVKSDEASSATIELSPSAVGKGSLSLSVSWEGTGYAVSGVSATLGAEGGASESLAFAISGTTASCAKTDLTPGAYLVSISVSGTNALSRKLTESVLIYNGRSSTASLAVTADELCMLYRVAYDANDSTSGSAPVDSAAYQSGDAVQVMGNTGNLAKTGYDFSGWNAAKDGSGTSYAAGASLTMGSADLTLYAKWAAIPPVTLLAIPGVAAPATGNSPVTSIDASQYAGSISWSPAASDVFASGTVYTATITLTPKTGFSLTGVMANGFTVAGATATNSADSGVVTAVFPKTSDPNPNLALNCPVTVSSEQSDQKGNRLVDGDTGAQWCANMGGNAWFIVDLGAIQSIKTIKLYPSFYNDGTLEFSIQGSNDGSTWVDVKNPVSYAVKSPATDATNIYTITDLSIQYRYLKFASITWQGWVACYEFEVYGI